MSLRMADEATRIFRKYDIDGSGSLSIDEFRMLVNELSPGEELYASLALKEFDTNGDGTMDFAEFLAWMQLHGSNRGGIGVSSKMSADLHNTDLHKTWRTGQAMMEFVELFVEELFDDEDAKQELIDFAESIRQDLCHAQADCNEQARRAEMRANRLNAALTETKKQCSLENAKLVETKKQVAELQARYDCAAHRLQGSFGGREEIVKEMNKLNQQRDAGYLDSSSHRRKIDLLHVELERLRHESTSSQRDRILANRSLETQSEKVMQLSKILATLERDHKLLGVQKTKQANIVQNLNILFNRHKFLAENDITNLEDLATNGLLDVAEMKGLCDQLEILATSHADAVASAQKAESDAQNAEDGAEAKGGVTCPSGHYLECYVSDTPLSHNCDGECGRQDIRPPEQVFRCSKCDYDLCQRCYAQEQCAQYADEATASGDVNDEGAKVSLGDSTYAHIPGADGTGKYYCGRHLGVEAIPGSDGQCGPTGGPQCASCSRLQIKKWQEGALQLIPKKGRVEKCPQDPCVQRERERVDAEASAYPHSNGGFRTYRFTPLETRDRGSSCVQIAGISFQCGGVPVDMLGTTATNPGGRNPSGEGPSNAIDGKTSTKWLDANKGALVVSWPRTVPIDSFRFMTANDEKERDPVKWKLEGLSGDSWILLHSQDTKYATPSRRFTFTEWFWLEPLKFSSCASQ